jgi:hypothetical protein
MMDENGRCDFLLIFSDFESVVEMNEWEGDKGILFNDMLFDQYGVTIDDAQATWAADWLYNNTPDNDRCKLTSLVKTINLLAA